MARATALIALSCDTIRLCSSSSMRRSLADSSSLRAEMGMPVHFDTTSSMSPLVTWWAPGLPMSQCSRTICRFSRCATSSSRKKALLGESPRSTTTRILRENSGASSRAVASRSFTRLPASSSRSMALSGRNRSVM